MMQERQDMQDCAEMIRHGSLSFHAASKLLPKDVREPALALYAFCRLADDAVDLQQEKAAAVLQLQERLDRVYEGRPRNAAPDRAFAAVVERFDMPRALPDALLEGLAWDAMENRYATLSDLISYSARVASAVGVMMCVLMRVRDPDALARACDLGVAMQLTNIARDVGEDALERRLYLPTDWMDEVGLTAEAFFDQPRPSKAVCQMTKRLLLEANRLYYRSEAGIAALPRACRPGILAARHIYAGIGGQVRKSGYDSVSTRAHTSKRQKLGWVMLSATQAGVGMVMPKSAVLYAKPLPEVQFLIDATADRSPEWSRQDTLIEALARLAAVDRDRRQGMGNIHAEPTSP